MNKYYRLIASIFICELTGVIGSLFTIPSVSSWYAALNKPFFNPPNWLFGPVWVLLYFFMGVSLFLVWEGGRKNEFYKQAIIMFYIQLSLNLLWSIIFFGMHTPFFALQVIAALWIFIIFTLINFIRISRAAGFILIPYLLWVSFAAVLNFFIVILNPSIP